MTDLRAAGRGLAQSGATATPRQNTHQQKNQIDGGFNSYRNAPPPPPRRDPPPPPPRDTTRR